MAYVYIPRSHYNALNHSALYCLTIEVLDGVTSDDYILPIAQITGIGAVVQAEDTAALHYTMDAPEVIEEEEADWFEWDGLIPLSTCITGIRLVSTVDPAVAKITIRTLKG